MFSAAVEGGAWPLALIGVLASSVAAFFYVRIIVLMFFTEPAGADGEATAAAALAPSAEGFALAGDSAVAVEAEPVVQARSTVTTTVVGTEGFAVVAIAVCALADDRARRVPVAGARPHRVRGDVPAVTHACPAGSLRRDRF